MRKITNPAKAQFAAAYGFARVWCDGCPDVYAPDYDRRIKARAHWTAPAGAQIPRDDEYIVGWDESLEAAKQAIRDRREARRTAPKPGAVIDAQDRLGATTASSWDAIFGKLTAADALRQARIR